VVSLRAIAAGCLLAALLASGAAASEPIRVLLVIDQNDDPFAERIRAELVNLGLQVVTAETWRTGEPVVALDAATRAAQAAAGIRMIHSRKGVEIWMADQPTGRSLLRQLIVDERAGEPNQGLVALQTAELLRTSLLAPPPPRKPPETAPAVAAEPAPPTVVAYGPEPPLAPRAGVQAAFGALVSPEAGDAAVQTWLSLYRFLNDSWALSLDVSAPVRNSSMSGPEGIARITTFMVGAAMFTSYEDKRNGFYATGGGGVGILRLEASGAAVDPFVSHVQSAFTGAVYARGDAGLEAARWLRFGVRGVVGATTSKVTVRFAGNEAGVWGRPFLGGMVIAELTWR
jgi:hypothetical protein